MRILFRSGNMSETWLFDILFRVFMEFVMADTKSLCKEFKRYTNLSFDITNADDTSIANVHCFREVTTLR